MATQYFMKLKNSFSCQIGNGNQICAVTNLKTVTDFRSLNVAFWSRSKF